MVIVPKSRNSNQTLEGSRGTSRGLVDTSFAFVTVDRYIYIPPLFFILCAILVPHLSR